MNDKQSALNDLADIMMSKKDIDKLLLKHAEQLAIGCLKRSAPIGEARAWAVFSLMTFLEGRCFSGFARKKTIDRAVSKAFRYYAYHLRLKKAQRKASNDARSRRLNSPQRNYKPVKRHDTS